MPTSTFPVTLSADDQYVYKTGSTVYPPNTALQRQSAGNITVAKQQIATSNYQTYVGLVRFDTSALPDNAAVSAATLNLNVTFRASSTDNRSLTGEWYAWSGSAASDYTDTASSSAFSTTLAGLVVGVNAIALSSPDANVSRAGYTSLRLHVSGGQPTLVSNTNFINAESFNDAGSSPPSLSVTYATIAGDLVGAVGV